MHTTSSSYIHQVHSNLPNIMHVTTKLRVILRRTIGFTWMHNNNKIMLNMTLWNNIKSTLQQQQWWHVMCASTWFEFYGGLLKCQNLCYMGGKCDNKERDINRTRMLPRVLGYERRSDITEGKVYQYVNVILICVA